ncbi:beta-galactosidase [Cellulomonas soli]
MPRRGTARWCRTRAPTPRRSARPRPWGRPCASSRTSRTRRPTAPWWPPTWRCCGTPTGGGRSRRTACPRTRLSYPDTLRRTHRALYRQGLPVDFVAPGGDLSAYRLLVVPALYAMDDDTVAWLEHYVREQGGRLVVHHLTGIADSSMRVTTGGYPGRLRDLLGVRVEQVRPLAADDALTLDDGSRATVWSELVHLHGATALRTYAGGALDGRPAVTEHRSGAGVAVYVSAQLDEPDLGRFLAEQTVLAEVRPVLAAPAPDGVEVVRRRGATSDHLFVLNHTAGPVEVRGPGDTTATVVAPGGHLVVPVPVDEPAPLVAWTVRSGR